MDVLVHIEIDRQQSVRLLAAAYGFPNQVFIKFLKLHPYKVDLKLVQEFNEDDDDRRFQLCEYSVN